MDRNDPAYRNDVDPTAPGYTPVDDVTVPGDGSGTAPENQESGNEAIGAGAGALGGAAVGMAVGGPPGAVVGGAIGAAGGAGAGDKAEEDATDGDPIDKPRY